MIGITGGTPFTREALIVQASVEESNHLDPVCRADAGITSRRPIKYDANLIARTWLHETLNNVIDCACA
ncbi:MAG: hypothetical protein ACP5M1_11985 [Acidiphilium sp.]